MSRQPEIHFTGPLWGGFNTNVGINLEKGKQLIKWAFYQKESSLSAE